MYGFIFIFLIKQAAEKIVKIPVLWVLCHILLRFTFAVKNLVKFFLMINAYIVVGASCCGDRKADHSWWEDGWKCLKMMQCYMRNFKNDLNCYSCLTKHTNCWRKNGFIQEKNAFILFSTVFICVVFVITTAPFALLFTLL